MSLIMPINVSEIDKQEMKNWIDSFDVILCDCDGVLWSHNNLFDGANIAINRLVEMGKKVYLITNNSGITREELLQKCNKMEFNLEIDNLLPASYITAQYLKQKGFNKKAYVMGTESLGKELKDAGINFIGIGKDPMEHSLYDFFIKHFDLDEEVGAVIIGFDSQISFPKIAKAVNYLTDPSIEFIATNTDETFVFPFFVLPENGGFVKMIESGSGRKATVMGKPSSELCELFFKDKIHSDSRKILMIGDRLNTDVLFGNNNKFQTLHVGTGIHKLDDIQQILNQIEEGDKDPELEKLIPDFYCPSLGELLNNYD